jgi:hypothetical protein
VHGINLSTKLPVYQTIADSLMQRSSQSPHAIVVRLLWAGEVSLEVRAREPEYHVWTLNDLKRATALTLVAASALQP